MPKADNAKTASAHRISLPISLMIASVLAIVIASCSLIRLHNDQQVTVMHVGSKTYQLIVSDTNAERTKGLGYRSTLPSNEGMLFIFNSSAKLCFWMKGMQFPLDMVWLNSNKQIVYLKSQISPKTYPEIFCSSESAQYVIELNAGQAQAADLRDSETLSF